VEICFRVLGEIKIDNNIHSLNIYSPCKKICKGKEKMLEPEVKQQSTSKMEKYVHQRTNSLWCQRVIESKIFCQANLLQATKKNN